MAKVINLAKIKPCFEGICLCEEIASLLYQLLNILNAYGSRDLSLRPGYVVGSCAVILGNILD